jgi:hypothetical protein
MDFLLSALAGGITYDAFRYVVGSLALSVLGTALMKYSFDKLKEKRQILIFGAGTFAVLLILFSFLGTRPQAADLHGQIEQALLGTVTGSDRDTISVITINIVNSGNTQSIVKNWKVQAEANGNVYDGMFVQMPPTLTFGNIPRTTLMQPTSITFHSEDNVSESPNKAIEVGGSMTGLLFVVFSNIDQSIFRGPITFTVSYRDAFERPYSVSAKSTGQVGQISAIAGVHSELACPMPADITGSLPKNSPAMVTPLPAQPRN